jgi:hypothetical protein
MTSQSTRTRKSISTLRSPLAPLVRAAALLHLCFHLCVRPLIRSKISATQREPLPARARSGLPAKLPAFYEPTRCSKTAPDQVSLGGDIGDVSLVSFFWKMTRASQV